MGTVQNSYTYGAWGELRAQNVTVANSYGYTGREFGEEGLYFYRARYLDPGVGRFLSEDHLKILEESSLYFYVGNNPVQYIDPSGFKKLKLGVCEEDLKDCLLKAIRNHIDCDLHVLIYQIVCEAGCAVICQAGLAIAPACFLACTAGCAALAEPFYLICHVEFGYHIYECFKEYSDCRKNIKKDNMCELIQGK
jgi:RHS repeat-associated protein